MTPSDGFSPLDKFRTADVSNSPTTAPSMVSPLTAAYPEDLDLAFRRLKYYIFSVLNDTLEFKPLYIGADLALEDQTFLKKFREFSRFLSDVSLRLPDEITEPL